MILLAEIQIIETSRAEFKFWGAKPDWLRYDPKLVIDEHFWVLLTGTSYSKTMFSKV